MAEAQLTNQLTRIDSMTNVELRAELKRRGCPTSGNKKDLLAKLRVALQKEYEQTALETASTVSTMDSMSFDGRNNNMSGLQQSPVVPFDVSRPMLNNSTASSNSYMTPHGGSPITYAQQMHSGEAPLTYNNLQMHDQNAGQYASVYNLSMHQPMHQSPTPMIPIPQQLTISPSERHQMYDPSLLHNQQQQQQQFTPMNTRRGRPSVDTPLNHMISPTVPVPSPEKRTRSRSKKPSVDSQPLDIEQQHQQIYAQMNFPVENLPSEVINNAPVQQAMHDELIMLNPLANENHGNNVELNPFVSKSHEEEQKDVEKDGGDRGNSRSPSVDSSSAKSESVIKEIPLSGERHRLSRSKSPKSRWHHSPSPPHPLQDVVPSVTNDGAQNSAVASQLNDQNGNNDPIDKSATVALFADETGDLGGDETKKDEPLLAKQKETAKVTDAPSTNNRAPEKASPEQQQSKPARSQAASSSSTLMKGLNRATTNNRMNLSSDILKTLIPDISLAPESLANDELEASTVEQSNGDHAEASPNQTMLETSVGSGFLFSDSMTIGDMADQKQPRNRTVVIDLAVDSSSLNDDLVGNSSDGLKKNPGPPTRIASFESKPLLDGKTNALMMDQPVRVQNVTAAREPPSKIVFIRGLTRPFTLPQLKELLSHYGELVDGELWLDKIKSQCFVTYHTLEDAQKAREALDGCRWPSTNPKTLLVRFGRQDEFDFSKASDLSPDQMPSDGMEITNHRIVQEKSSSTTKTAGGSRRSASPTDENRNSNKRLRTSGNADVREWDIPKLQQDNEKAPTERQVIEEQTVKSDEPPAKGLDDYFRKTKAKPAIYWLPLNEEQIIERTRQQEQRNAERDEQQKKRELEEVNRAANISKDSKSRSNNSNAPSSSQRSHRRSASPNEKRKRISPSSSPPKRDNKRY